MPDWYLAASGVAAPLGGPVARLAPFPPHRQRRQVFVRLARQDKLLSPVVLLVDGLPAGHRDSVAPAAALDLLRRPVLAHLRLDELPHPRHHLAAGRRLVHHAAVGLALGLLVPVSLLAGVAPQLARHRGRGASDPARNVAARTPLFTERLDYDTFLLRQAVVLRSPGWGLPFSLCGHCFLLACLGSQESIQPTPDFFNPPET